LRYNIKPVTIFTFGFKEQIPLELQTLEAMKAYIQKLEENVSNR